MLVLAVFGSYQTAQAAEIVAGYTIGQVLESILLGFGISIFTADMIANGTSASWWETDGSAALKPYYDDLEEEYEQQRFKVINGGGGNPEPSPTPQPGNSPIPFPTSAPVSGDIPTFQELVAPALAGTAAFVNMTQEAWECMGTAVSNLWNKMMGRFDISSIPSEFWGYLSESSGYPYYILVYKYEVGKYELVLFGEGSCRVKSSGMYRNGYKYYRYQNKSYVCDVYESSSFGYDWTDSRVFDLSKEKTNILTFSSISEADKWRKNVLANADKYVKENIWVHPDLQDTYKNNGKLEYPQQAQQPLQIPSGEQLADTVKKLNPEINPSYSPEIAPNYIQELIQQLQRNPSTDPDPNPDPAPDPDPNPDPNPNPDVKPTGVPEPEPTQKPDDSSENIDPKNYTTDLQKIFPFCIPFDLIHLIKAFEAEPEAPVFKIPFDMELENPFTGKKVVDYHHTFELDMSDYDSVIKIFRIFEVIFFIIGLLLITRQQMIKG